MSDFNLNLSHEELQRGRICLLTDLSVCKWVQMNSMEYCLTGGNQDRKLLSFKKEKCASVLRMTSRNNGCKICWCHCTIFKVWWSSTDWQMMGWMDWQQMNEWTDALTKKHNAPRWGKKMLFTDIYSHRIGTLFYKNPHFLLK